MVGRTGAGLLLAGGCIEGKQGVNENSEVVKLRNSVAELFPLLSLPPICAATPPPPPPVYRDPGVTILGQVSTGAVVIGDLFHHLHLHLCVQSQLWLG